MHVGNVHEANTHFSHLIDAAHAGETILVAKEELQAIETFSL